MDRMSHFSDIRLKDVSLSGPLHSCSFDLDSSSAFPKMQVESPPQKGLPMPLPIPLTLISSGHDLIGSPVYLRAARLPPLECQFHERRDSVCLSMLAPQCLAHNHVPEMYTECYGLNCVPPPKFIC